jgi:pyruvate formate lyase activating enzyme
MKESYLYKKLKNNLVKCETCQHACTIQSDQRGICGVRQNQDGRLMALNYGKAIAAHVDPIEKKPIYHFLPGTYSYSVATVGCNFRCLHCQNYDISQFTKEGWSGEIIGDEYTPDQIVENAIDNGCPSISYTYTEPTIFLEYALDTMKLAREKGLKNIWVSNGYMSQKTLELIIPYLDAINVDLKSFSDKFYNQVCGAKLQPVLDNLVKIKKSGIHLEVTTLIIPTKNDSEKELKQIAEFIVNQLGDDTPWHVTAFYPTYKMMHLPATPRQKIYQAIEIGKKAGLKFVHGGNI